MNTMKVALFAIGVCLATFAQAQDLDGVRGKREIIAMGLYPPDIIMKHQQRLDITDAQRRGISSVVQKFQAEVSDLQWTLQNGQQLLQQSLRAYPVEAQDTMEQVKKVLALESEFKQAHFKMLIAIKNELTQEQVEMINRTIKQKVSQRRQ